jgi:hypothetical protein
VLYRELTAPDAIGPYEVLRLLPDAEVRLQAPVSGGRPAPQLRRAWRGLRSIDHITRLTWQRIIASER